MGVSLLLLISSFIWFHLFVFRRRWPSVAIRVVFFCKYKIIHCLSSPNLITLVLLIIVEFVLNCIFPPISVDLVEIDVATGWTYFCLCPGLCC